MDCGFDIASTLGAPSEHEGPYVGRADQAFLRSNDGKELADLVDQLCEERAQALETSAQAIRSTDDTAYVIVEGHILLGLARVGVRNMQATPPSADAPDPSVKSSGGYAAHLSRLQQISPHCLLDFFVATGFQRRGLGRRLFDEVLVGERLANPAKLVYISPTMPLYGFLEKHFQLKGSTQTDTRSKYSNFLLFDGYFRDAANGVGGTSEPGESPASIPAVAESEPVKACTDAGGATPAKNALDAYTLFGESAIYTEVAKLYRFGEDGKWDAGVAGKVTLLTSRTDVRTRLVFQLTPSTEIVLNHFLETRPGFCELERQSAGNEKTWVWTAKCRVLEERVAMKFKSTDVADGFKAVFDRGKPPAGDAVDYAVLRVVGATEGLDLNSKHVKVFSPGDVAKVFDVRYVAEEMRVRARISNPLSWITLMSHNETDVGCYAVEQAGVDRYSEAVKRRQGS